MSMRQTAHYLNLADAFRYPGEDFAGLMDQCQSMLARLHPDAAAEFRKFSCHVGSLTREQREELYVKTFDVQALCYPELGFVLFGEDYKRGMFLVHMKREQDKAGNDVGTDLADHISNVLTLLEKTSDDEFREELAVAVVVPALKKMLEGFDNDGIRRRMEELRKKHDAIVGEDMNYGNVYQFALKALLQVLEQDFADVHLDIPAPSARAIPIIPEMAAGTSFLGNSRPSVAAR